MKWFRSNIKCGSQLVLLAVVIQLTFSFGHLHGVAAQVAFAQQPPASDSDSGQPSGDSCAICAVISLANTALFATPPLLLLPQAIEFLYQAIDAAFVHLTSAYTSFQPRAPPAS